MKKEYIKPELCIKAYAQFEDVFTACNKGNAHQRHCRANTASHSGVGYWAAAFKAHKTNCSGTPHCGGCN